MKIKWFISRNVTYFRVLANQYDICAHSIANHYTPCTRKRHYGSVIFISVPCSCCRNWHYKEIDTVSSQCPFWRADQFDSTDWVCRRETSGVLGNLLKWCENKSCFCANTEIKFCIQDYNCTREQVSKFVEWSHSAGCAVARHKTVATWWLTEWLRKRSCQNVKITFQDYSKTELIVWMNWWEIGVSLNSLSQRISITCQEMPSWKLCIQVTDQFLSFDFFQPPMLSLSTASALCYKWKLTGEINLELSHSSTCCE